MCSRKEFSFLRIYDVSQKASGNAAMQYAAMKLGGMRTMGLNGL